MSSIIYNSNILKMQSTINNSNNTSAFAFANESDFEKNEHYTEFGLAKG